MDEAKKDKFARKIGGFVAGLAWWGILRLRPADHPTEQRPLGGDPDGAGLRSE
jgi:hypothetical protein